MMTITLVVIMLLLTISSLIVVVVVVVVVVVIVIIITIITVAPKLGCWIRLSLPFRSQPPLQLWRLNLRLSSPQWRILMWLKRSGRRQHAKHCKPPSKHYTGMPKAVL
jgi:hypothetical protein